MNKARKRKGGAKLVKPLMASEKPKEGQIRGMSKYEKPKNCLFKDMHAPGLEERVKRRNVSGVCVCVCVCV